MDLSPDKLKKHNSLLVWYSEKELKDLIIFLNKNGFYFNEKRKNYYNDELNLLLEQEDLVNIINNNDFLFKKIKKDLEKKDRKSNYIKDDIRVAGYYINLFLFLGIINLFLGWIFFHILIWVFIQLFLMFSFVVFLKMRKKIIRKINTNKKMLVDDIKIHVKAGKGGNGVVSFNKNLMEQGPTGGSGGMGGNVILRGVLDIGALSKFRYKSNFIAENGKDGMIQNRDGSNGKNLVLSVPIGTVIYKNNDNLFCEISKTNEECIVAKGGKGGRGNFHFRSSKNTSPKEFEYGIEGEECELRLELKLIADVGFIGLPNVGKSSLLNELTNAKSRVANYPFTTLEPSLGAYYELILADIPGLIKGASDGKGLGIKFLKHIERTKILFHFISSDSTSPLNDYNVVREELQKHNKLLLEKKEYILLSKTDNVEEETVNKIINSFKQDNKEIIPISILDDKSLLPVKEILNEIKEKK